jgi:glycosyltransferase involved in cell wall biosynthesis
MSTCKISIFMPVYNGSSYLAETIDSILNQTFKDFELVCVDDSSTDNSHEILKEYATIDSRVKVFQKPNGGIVSKSWNFVLPFLNGERFMYMSQDDLLSKDNLELLYKKQQKTGADCVLPDMVYYYDNQPNDRVISGLNGDKSVVLTNREAVVHSLTWRIHGFALWNATLLKNEHFEEDCFDSDEFMTRKLFFKSNKIVFSDAIFYYRQDNAMAITKTFGLKNYDRLLTDFRIYEFLKDSKFEDSILNPFLFQLSISYSTWYRMFLMKKGMKSKTDIINIRLKLAGYFSKFKKYNLFQMSKSLNGMDKVRAFINAIVLHNFFIFKLYIRCVHFYDMSFLNKKDL